MHRRTLALLLLLASTGLACESGYGYGRESGGVSQSMSSVNTGPIGPPSEPPPPPPSGGFGPVQVSPDREQPAAVTSSPAGGSGASAADCWASPVLTEYMLQKNGGKPSWVAAANDGSVWFSDPATTSVARLEPSGAVTRYTFPEGRTPGSLVVARDGSIWVATVGPAIAHLRPDGRLVGYEIPKSQPYTIGGTGDVSPAALTLGPDGAVWFLEVDADRIGRVTSNGVVTDYPLLDRDRMHTHPQGMTVGPDGALWFSATLKMRMGRIDPKTFAITEFPVPSSPNGIGVSTVTVGSDGALWYEGGSGLGRMTTSGDVRLFPLPWQGQYQPNSITAGLDGRLWFIDGRWGKVVRMTQEGEVSELHPVADPRGLHVAGPGSMDAGPHAVWFAEPALNRIGRFACRRSDSSDAV
jgi:virginiamycin B lyase